MDVLLATQAQPPLRSLCSREQAHVVQCLVKLRCAPTRLRKSGNVALFAMTASLMDSGTATGRPSIQSLVSSAPAR